MSQQNITIGTANAGAGDTPFTAWTKTQANFTDLYANKRQLIPIYNYGKTITFFGDSYTAGLGASSSAVRWTTLLSKYLGATEDNRGVTGTTVEKRSPIDWAGTPNMVDNIPTIPTKTASLSLLVFAFGLNDMGYVGANYTTANYITDYTTVLNAAIADGWDPSQILIIGAYYIGSAGYAAYASLSGQAAPTLQRHLDFIAAAQTVANTFGCLYLDIYHQQLLNNTTLISVDGIHPTDAGYFYIANEVYSYLYGAQLKYGTINVDNMIVANSTSTAMFLGAGGTLTSLTDHQILYGGGAYFDGSSFKTLPTATSAAIINVGNNQGNLPGYSFYLNTGLAANTAFGPTEIARIGTAGWYIGGTVTNATAKVQIGAGTTAAGSAPLKLTSGPLMTTPEDGAIEYDGTHFYVTIGSTRSQLVVV